MLKPVYPSAFRKYESRMDGMSGCPNATCPGVPVKVESPREIQRSCVCCPKLQQNFVVIKITASRKNGGGSPQASAADHGEAGNLPQHIASEKLLLLFDLFTRDHSDAGADLLGRSFRAGCGYNNFFLHRSET